MSAASPHRVSKTTLTVMRVCRIASAYEGKPKRCAAMSVTITPKDSTLVRLRVGTSVLRTANTGPLVSGNACGVTDVLRRMFCSRRVRVSPLLLPKPSVISSEFNVCARRQRTCRPNSEASTVSGANASDGQMLPWPTAPEYIAGIIGSAQTCGSRRDINDDKTRRAAHVRARACLGVP